MDLRWDERPARACTHTHTHARTHTRAHTHTRTRTRAHTHTHTHTSRVVLRPTELCLSLSLSLALLTLSLTHTGTRQRKGMHQVCACAYHERESVLCIYRHPRLMPLCRSKHVVIAQWSKHVVSPLDLSLHTYACMGVCEECGTGACTCGQMAQRPEGSPTGPSPLQPRRSWRTHVRVLPQQGVGSASPRHTRGHGFESLRAPRRPPPPPRPR